MTGPAPVAGLRARRRAGRRLPAVRLHQRRRAGLTGSVRNDSSGAIIEVEGDATDLDDFLARLTRDAPPLAVIESVETQEIPVVGGTGFVIADTSRSDGGRTLASPDVAMCAECAAEQRDPADRRYRHAFVNCTNCGPRFTIIASLPYDRAATTMAAFPMCADCAREYARSGRPAIPRAAGLLPELRADAALPVRRRRRRGRRIGTEARPAVATRRRCAGRQGHRRLPPGLRRRQRARGRRAATPKAPRRQAVRGHGGRSGRQRIAVAAIDAAIGALAVGCAATHRADAAAGRRTRRRIGGAAQPGSRRDAGLHAAAHTAVRAARRRAGTVRCW